jgi:hypothetical protein
MCCIQHCMQAVLPFQQLERIPFVQGKQFIALPPLAESIYFSRLALSLPLGLLALLGLVPVLVGQNGYWGLLHLVLWMSAAVAILYVSRTRAEYLWLGALCGIALILAPLRPGQTVAGPLWPDVICVAVFVAYYRLCIAGSRTQSHSDSGHGSGHRAG